MKKRLIYLKFLIKYVETAKEEIMSNSYYYGGDRDDANNYSSNDWRSAKKIFDKPLSKKVAPQPSVTFKIPSCFDEDFYNDHAHKYSKSSEDYWEWKKFCGYAIEVYSFFRQAAVEFYSKYPPVEKLPDFVDLKLKQENLQEVLEHVMSAENTVIMQFNRSRRTLKAKLDSIKRLREVRDYAAMAWLMHYASTANLYIKDAINFKNAIDKQYNFNDDLDVIKTFRGCHILKQKTNLAIKPNLLTTKLQRPQDLYADVDATKIINNLLKTVGGYDLASYDMILSNITDRIEELKENSNYAPLIYFYENYAKMKRYISYVKNKMFFVQDKDIFKNLKNFTDYIHKFLNANENLDEILKRDLINFVKEAEEILTSFAEDYAKIFES